MFVVQTEILPNSVFTYSKYRKDNLSDLKMQFDVFQRYSGTPDQVSHGCLVKRMAKVVLLLWILLLFVFRVRHVFLPCGHPCWERVNLLLVCDVFLSFCHFPMWCPVSGAVLDCTDS